jgi:hypothetical protein
MQDCEHGPCEHGLLQPLSPIALPKLYSVVFTFKTLIEASPSSGIFQSIPDMLSISLSVRQVHLIRISINRYADRRLGEVVGEFQTEQI